MSSLAAQQDIIEEQAAREVVFVESVDRPSVSVQRRDDSQDSAENSSIEGNARLRNDVRHGAEHVIKLFIPVSLCMLVVVSTISNVQFYTTKDMYLLYTPFHETSPDTLTKVWNAAANSLILLAFVITTTVVLIGLYKYRCYKIIHGWLMMSTLMLMFLFSTLFFEEMLHTYNVSMDIFTIAVFVWNFGVTGLLVIHWKGPLIVQQVYLIFIAALMALVFIKYLPEWTTWALLFTISIWDIVAVLSPRGPLKVLVDIAHERNENIFPALIYSAMAHWVGDTEENKVENKESPSEQQCSLADEFSSDDVGNSISLPVEEEILNLQNSADMSDNLLPTTARDDVHCVLSNSDVVAGSEAEFSNIPYLNLADVAISAPCPTCNRVGNSCNSENRCDECHQIITNEQSDLPTEQPTVQNQSDSSEEEDKGIHLGLGDFIFYSVLVGKASTYGDWNTTFACFVAILVGMCVTLSLLVIFKKALPALPISICLGLIFYFATIVFVKPFFELLASNQVFI